MGWKQECSVGIPEIGAQRQTLATCMALIRDSRDNATATVDRAPAQADLPATNVSNRTHEGGNGMSALPLADDDAGVLKCPACKHTLERNNRTLFMRLLLGSKRYYCWSCHRDYLRFLGYFFPLH